MVRSGSRLRGSSTTSRRRSRTVTDRPALRVASQSAAAPARPPRRAGPRPPRSTTIGPRPPRSQPSPFGNGWPRTATTTQPTSTPHCCAKPPAASDRHGGEVHGRDRPATLGRPHRVAPLPGGEVQLPHHEPVRLARPHQLRRSGVTGVPGITIHQDLHTLSTRDTGPSGPPARADRGRTLTRAAPVRPRARPCGPFGPARRPGWQGSVRGGGT